jgi:hypothetical protein
VTANSSREIGSANSHKKLPPSVNGTLTTARTCHDLPSAEFFGASQHPDFYKVLRYPNINWSHRHEAQTLSGGAAVHESTRPHKKL